MSEAISDTKEEKSKGRGLWRPIALIVVVVVLVIIFKVWGIDKRLMELQGWINGLGFLGYLVFVAMYIAAVVAGIPGLAITIAAGALFESVVGVILVSIGSTVGASLAFLVARYFAKDAVDRWLSTKEKFRRLDKLTEEQGAIIVAITRLIPLFPFNILNYGFGLTKVRFFTYVFWSWLCMLPMTVVYVVGINAGIRGISQGQVPWGLMGIVAITLVILTILGIFARQKLKAGEESA